MSTAVASVVTSGDLAGTCQHFGEMHLQYIFSVKIAKKKKIN
jgi:hypothetical protein